LQSVEESKKKTSETLEVAFSDLSALMGKAADLVSIAEKLTKRLETEGNDEENTQMRSYLIELGISSPVTRFFFLSAAEEREKGGSVSTGEMNGYCRESAGSVYHEELSRQLAEFLDKALKREGGMITLPDLYCIFNRARGTGNARPSGK